MWYGDCTHHSDMPERRDDLVSAPPDSGADQGAYTTPQDSLQVPDPGPRREYPAHSKESDYPERQERYKLSRGGLSLAVAIVLVIVGVIALMYYGEL